MTSQPQRLGESSPPERAGGGGDVAEPSDTAGKASTTEVDPQVGLTSVEVEDRVARGLGNDLPNAPSRTVAEILRANIITRFNLLMAALLAIVLVNRAWRDALFGGVIIANSIVGIVQELRAKVTLDRLAVLNSPRVFVVRDSQTTEIGVSDIVLDDIMELRSGQQVAADANVVLSGALEVDESLLTGESDPVVKQVGDELRSGSFVVSGSGKAQVAKVGADAYAVRLAEEARRFTLARSELRESIDRIVKWISWAIVPVGLALFWTQYSESSGDVSDAMVKATGGVVAMVPEGLILLLSVAFAVGVVRLARKRTLVQELPAIETLARVDTVCLDKTGTITSGEMELAEIVDLTTGGDESSAELTDELSQAIAAVAHSEPDPNATQQALVDAYPEMPQGWEQIGVVAFSSARKWSAASFAERGTWVVGAPEMVIDGDGYDEIADRVTSEAEAGRRVLVLASTNEPLDGDGLPSSLEARCLLLIEDQIRPDAAETFEYFAKEGVRLKVISGDNPATVAAVASRAGLADAEQKDQLCDARDLPEDMNALADALERTTVFGRVSPHQKRAMVGALQSRGHVVAMTGDGVNDVLALKDADVGIAMASGSEATRAVAQLVLLDSTFSGLPGAVAEGRKVINNLQRVASLFLTKTVWAMLIAVVTSVARLKYPFLPRQITIVSTGIIGIPSFLLALDPATERVSGNFLAKVSRVAIPSGTITAAVVLLGYVYALNQRGLDTVDEQTTATLIIMGMSFVVLLRTAQPWALWKIGMCVAIGFASSVAILVPGFRRFFELRIPSTEMWIVITGMIALGAVAMWTVEVVWRRLDILRRDPGQSA